MEMREPSVNAARKVIAVKLVLKERKDSKDTVGSKDIQDIEELSVNVVNPGLMERKENLV